MERPFVSGLPDQNPPQKIRTIDLPVKEIVGRAVAGRKKHQARRGFTSKLTLATRRAIARMIGERDD